MNILYNCLDKTTECLISYQETSHQEYCWDGFYGFSSFEGRKLCLIEVAKAPIRLLLSPLFFIAFATSALCCTLFSCLTGLGDAKAGFTYLKQSLYLSLLMPIFSLGSLGSNLLGATLHPKIGRAYDIAIYQPVHTYLLA